ncbi:hypothetical protein Avbf_01225 [Armadillidium vulgare]|nr:hypothetical protein Avbf_01225 [Armadillidium vulgare]
MYLSTHFDVIVAINQKTLNATAIGGPTTSTHSPSTKDEEEMRILKEREVSDPAFYATYNVWTGIRTAVTLTLFFLFTVTVILSTKANVNDTDATNSIQALKIFQEDQGGDNAASGSRKVEVHENYCRTFEEAANEVVGSAPIPTHLDRDSLSSYYNSFRIKSLPGSAMRLNFSRMGSYEREEAVQYATASGRQEYLRVPGVRLQSTCSSSDGCSLGSSSYDIPYDNTPLTLLNVPGMTGKHKPAMQTGGIDWENDQAKADWLQTIDINVIHPTPNVSPCGSVRSISDHLYDGFSVSDDSFKGKVGFCCF